jgi:hypothetical protein
MKEKYTSIASALLIYVSSYPNGLLQSHFDVDMPIPIPILIPVTAIPYATTTLYTCTSLLTKCRLREQVEYVDAQKNETLVQILFRQS